MHTNTSCSKTRTERQGRILEAFSKLAETSRRGTGSAIGDPEQTSPADHPFRPTGAPELLCLLFIHPGAPNLISLRSAGTMPA